MLESDLKHLYEIQKLDIEIDGLKENLESVPKRIEQLTLDLEKHKSSIEREKNNISELNAKKKESSKRLENIITGLKKNLNKGKSVTTGREGEALLNEKTHLEKDKAMYEDRLQELDDSIKKGKLNLSNLEDSLGDVIKSTEEDIKLYNKKKKELTKEIEILDDKKKRIAVHIEDTTLIKKYERIRLNRDGIGMVMIDKPICGGCFVKLPYQLYNDVKLNEEIHYCEICGRILYWKGHIDGK